MNFVKQNNIKNRKVIIEEEEINLHAAKVNNWSAHLIPAYSKRKQSP